MKRLSLITITILALSAISFFATTDSVADEEQVLHFGYGSNMSESYMKQFTPSLKYVMNAQLQTDAVP